ncbi:helix-turn-helix domain-containing protein [Burkholderia sp. KBS0801]|uniref:helix-turn-helix domain-containing protein n=1 Tax=Burkholderia sp. KBS0801 TaxID=1179675 RepID=UPI0028F413B0|nr:helix-turn-helix domain-containing protein [Burkholderia sp. KBS0801]
MAAWMLMQPRKNISEIAAGCGFTDASRLGHKFRRAYGMWPRAYRSTRRPARSAG